MTLMPNPRPTNVRILSSGVVVVHWNADRYDYLLLRAYNYWDFPKGVVAVSYTHLDVYKRQVLTRRKIRCVR